MELFVTLLVAGITLGLLYALFAVGMGLVLRAGGDLNLAHGDSLMLATYVGVGTLAAPAGAAPGWLGVLVTVGVGALVGAVSYLLVYAPVAARVTPGRAALGFLPSLGVALLVRNAAILIDPQGSRPVDPVFHGSAVPLLGGAHVPGTTWWLVPTAIGVPLLVSMLVRHTGWGHRVRAVSDDPALARLNGIPVRRTLATTYALAGVVGSLAGVLFASFFGQLFVGLGWQATLAGFVAVVLGGVAKMRGALLGGLALGVLGSLTAGYISTTYKDVVTFGLLVLVLVAAPQGIQGVRRFRTV